MGTAPTSHYPERGAAALELALAAPLFVIVTALCLNLGTYMSCVSNANSAATAAARYLMDHPEQTDDENALRDYLDKIFPELGFDNGTSTVAVQITGREQLPYEYHLYDGDNLEKIPATNTFDRFRVTVTSTHSWPTFAALISDGSEQFTVAATRLGNADRTDGSTW